MSILERGEEKSLSREELIEWVRKRIAVLEEELRALKALLEILETGGSARGDIDPDESVEEVKIARRVLAIVGIGGDYVRVVPRFPMTIAGDIEAYLDTVVEEIRERQAREGMPPEERARLEARHNPDGTIRELRITGVTTPLERVKAKAALKYAVELAWQIARRRRQQEP